MATPKQVRRRGRFSLWLGAILATIAFVGVAYADNVQNDVVAGGNDTVVAGDSTTINYRITANNGDGETGCNAKVASPATVTINAPAAVSASPASLSFTSCDTNKPVAFTSSTPGDYEITVSVSDGGAGSYNTNPAKFTLHVDPAPQPTDTTRPVITPTVSGTLGNNGWYTSDVTVSWNVADPESSFTSTGCDSTTINADTDEDGTTLTCSATSAGGTATESVTIKRDATAPSISATRAPAANANGWNNEDVTVSFACSDATSGVASCTPPATVSTEGEGQSVTGTAVDKAGNSASATVNDINIDKTAPKISATRSPDANENGWNNTDVKVSFDCSDELSDIVSCDSPVTVSAEGAGQSVTGTAMDKAGNTASATVNDINIDKTAPSISATRTPDANENGWNNTDVTVSFDCSDELSEIASCDAPVTVSTEGAGQSVTGTAVDKAGNSAAATLNDINVDKTAPNVSLVGGPADGASYYFGAVPGTPTSDASDALSGLDGASSVSGYSAAVGTHTVTATAKDKAGNTNTASATYTVRAWTLRGFYQPVDMDKLNTVKNGSTVPFKFEIFAGSNELTDPANVKSFTSQQVNCSTLGNEAEDAIEVTTTGGTSLRYDTTGGQFINNWKTPAKAGSCYRVTMTTDDGSHLEANFKLK